MQVTRIADLPPNLQQEALAAFANLADAQRGKPEYAGGGGPLKSNAAKMHAIGCWLWMSEHIGDLTHRMSQRRCENIHYGASMIDEKCSRGLRMLKNTYGIEREIEENLRANYKYAGEKGYTGTFEQWREEWVQAAKFYADRHRELKVYNRAQYIARSAAIYVGELDYRRVTTCLEWLMMHIDGGTWEDVAGVVVFDDDGRLLTFEEWPQELKRHPRPAG